MSDTPITDVAEDQVHTFANGTMVVASNIARGLERKLTAAIAKLEETKVIYQLSPVDIYSFAGWLTTRPVTLTVGAEHKCYPIAEAVGEYLKTFPERFTASPMHDKVQELERELAAVTAERDALRAALAEAEKEEPRRELSDEEIEAIRARWCGTGGTYRELVDAFMRAAGGEG